MRNLAILLILLIVLVIAGGVFFWNSNARNGLKHSDTAQAAAMEEYIDEDYGISFKYPGGARGYTVIEPVVTPEMGPEKIIVLMKSRDVELQKSGRLGGEYPPAINIRVFKNPNQQNPAAWATENPEYANTDLMLNAMSSMTLGGKPAVRYRADGLYAADYLVIPNGNYMYLISGDFIDENSSIKGDFERLINSIQFSAGKNS
jgi:hypothetical protein